MNTLLKSNREHNLNHVNKWLKNYIYDTVYSDTDDKIRRIKLSYYVNPIRKKYEYISVNKKHLGFFLMHCENRDIHTES